MDIIAALVSELKLKPTQVQATVSLIDEGNTIPFIARYRKEQTGSLDDNVLRDLFDRLTYLRSLEKRREEIIAQIDSQGALSDELSAKLSAAATLSSLEDLYRPYRPKRRTRASMAKERGLEPLAELLLLQDPACVPSAEAERFINPELDVPDALSALAGASDIIAERVSDSADIRGKLRRFLLSSAVLKSTGDKEKAGVYALYCDFSEPVRKIAGYRVLAIDRGEREGFLSVSVACDDNAALDLIFPAILKKPDSACGELVSAAATDSWSRLLFPSLQNELRGTLTERADTAAIRVFSQNLRQLLLQPPLKNRVTMGVDPAYRTGCKIAVVDGTGKVLDTTVVYPTPPQSKKAEAMAELSRLIKNHGVQVFAIGNGTATGETEAFIAELIASLPEHNLSYMVVSEAGASVYSASKLAAEEFPQYDVSLRSAVSIGRRLQDPLSELVKIDPKAIGVGQYQHDMPQKELSSSLSGVVEGCVNSVGVDLNTASHSLLSYVAGINASVAKNIVSYREENGRFNTRSALLKVPKLGKKAFEQCAGFLRIAGGKEPLDGTAVHPESYRAAAELLTLCGYSHEDLVCGELSELRARAQGIGISQLCLRLSIGEATLQDMISELLRPGRDPREELPAPELRTGILDIKDLAPDMVLTGTVRNVIDFGAFVDIGVHQDGLVHVSQLSDRFVSHPLDVVKVGERVKVKVLEIDPKKKRISLTMKGIPQSF